MIRNRAWRRHIEEIKLVRRLKRLCQRGWYHEDINEIKHEVPRIVDYIGDRNYFLYKNISTTSWDSKYKVKYSPNKSRDYYRDEKSKGVSCSLRERDKILFLNILKENGLK